MQENGVGAEGHVRAPLEVLIQQPRRGHEEAGEGTPGGFLDGVAAQASCAVVPHWIDKLGGADVYTQANAYQLVESLRIDYGHLGPFGIHP